MRALGRALAAVGALLAGAAPARAAALGGDSALDMLFELLNLALLLGVIVYFARKPVQAYFAERRRAIQHELDESARLLATAEKTYADWQRKLMELDRELEEVRSTARERAHEERERILEEARAAAERIRRDAGAAVDQELRLARARLREEASDLAVEIAAGILKESVTPADQTRIVDDFIDEVARADGAPAGAGR